MNPNQRAVERQASTPGSRAATTLVALAALVGVMFLNAGCNHNESAAIAKTIKMPPVPVITEPVIKRDMPVEIMAIGNAEAMSSVTLRPQIDGQLIKANFAEGQDVHAGDLMLEIDHRPFEAALGIVDAQKAKDTAMAQDAERAVQQMSDAGKAVSERDLDKARAEAEAAKAQVNLDQAAIDAAKLRVEYCSIRSPIDGQVGAMTVKPGNVVKENETDLVQINQIMPIYVTFAVPEQELSEIKKHHAESPLTVEVTIPGDAAPPIHGTLVFIDNKVDATTGTIRLKAQCDNADRRLWPGQFVNLVLVVSTERDAVVVPSSAVQKGQKAKFVYVVKDDRTVELRTVTIKRTIGDQAVMASGLTQGEIVVTDGQLRLIPGAEVEISSPSANAPTATAGTQAR